MSAPVTSPGPILRELHRLLKYAKELQTRIEQAPKALQAQQTKLRRQEDALHAAQDALKKLKVHTHEKEVLIKTKRQQIAKYEKQLDEITSKKEFDALKHEIAGEQAAISQLEDEILNEMEEAEQRTAALPEVEKDTKKARTDLAEFERGTTERLAGFAAQRQQTLTELAQVAATLPDEVKPFYERQVKAKGEDALSGVENRTCIACYTELTAQHSNELNCGRFLTCKSCGRLLYLAE
jgi:predicted  nucleic acid-binding Zn-ribbon protein